MPIYQTDDNTIIQINPPTLLKKSSLHRRELKPHTHTHTLTHRHRHTKRKNKKQLSIEFYTTLAITELLLTYAHNDPKKTTNKLHGILTIHRGKNKHTHTHKHIP